ncbi:MAG: hypothetical protein GVY22_03980 [Gammaproteobacteria bacterium]|jgi:anaerobic ribonucleoside-triphosphate reductase|nr:hypothetical protein [Gammaproteobacteria bacterium]
MHTDPCIHLSAEPGRIRCQISRNAPRECAACAAYAPLLADADRTRCEVWTRVMGYHRPVSAFNPGKVAEHNDRQPFSAPR